MREFPGRVSLACSFQKEESVLLDMLYGIAPDARVFALDTHVLFPETYAVWRAVEERYKTKVEIYEGPTLARQAELHGDALWERRPDLCCAIRKVEPLGRALAGLDAWFTGLRREQSVTRTDGAEVEVDAAHGGMTKVNPLIAWSMEQVRAYAKTNAVPVHPLHDKGFPSIGCAPCTRAIQPGEHPRAGRWWWEDPENKECGLHLPVST